MPRPDDTEWNKPRPRTPAPRVDPVLLWPTPERKDLLFFVERNGDLPQNQNWKFGDPFEDRIKYPDHKLVHVSPQTVDKWSRWYFASNRINEDEYNYEAGWETVGGILVPSVKRSYIVPRSSYNPDYPTIGSEMPRNPENISQQGFKFDEGYILHISRQVRTDQELDSSYVAVELVYIKPVEAIGKEYGNIVTRRTTTTSVVDENTSPDAGISVIASNVSPLGNGKAILQTVQVDGGTWPNPVEHTLAKQRDNLIPQKFRNFVLTEATSEKLPEMPQTLSLSGDEISKIVKKETPDRYDKSTTVETIDQTVEPLFGQQVFFQFGGGVATTAESLVADGTSAEEGFTILSSSVTPLGNGKSIKEVVENSDEAYAPLTGQKFDTNLDLVFPFTRQVVEAGTIIAGADITPLDKWKSQAEVIDVANVAAQLAEIHTVFPTQQSIQLPNVLRSLSVKATRSLSNGNSYSAGNSGSSQNESSVSVSADILWEIEEGFSGAVPAEVHVFFLEVNSVTPESIAAAVGADTWPLYQPKSHRLVITGHGIRKSFSWGVSSGGTSASESGAVQAFTNVAVIPPCIHGEIEIDIVYDDYTAPSTYIDQYKDQIDAVYADRLDAIRTEVESGYYNGYLIDESQKTFLLSRIDSAENVLEFVTDLSLEDFPIQVSPSTLTATSPSTLSGGKYVFRSDVKLYGYGMVQVTAVVIDLSTIV